jgi:hypothetical protein
MHARITLTRGRRCVCYSLGHKQSSWRMHAPALLFPNGLHHLLDPALDLLLLRSCARTMCELRSARWWPLSGATRTRSQRGVPVCAGRLVHFLTSFSSFLLSFSPARAVSNENQLSVRQSWSSAHERRLVRDVARHYSRFAIAESVIAAPPADQASKGTRSAAARRCSFAGTPVTPGVPPGGAACHALLIRRTPPSQANSE